MGRVEKTVTVEVCDRCGREGHTVARCAGCKKELSTCCVSHFRARVERVTSFPGSWMMEIPYDMQDRTGFQATYCIDCAAVMEGALAQAGFSAFRQKPARPQ